MTEETPGRKGAREREEGWALLELGGVGGRDGVRSMREGKGRAGEGRGKGRLSPSHSNQPLVIMSKVFENSVIAQSMYRVLLNSSNNDSASRIIEVRAQCPGLFTLLSCGHCYTPKQTNLSEV